MEAVLECMDVNRYLKHLGRPFHLPQILILGLITGCSILPCHLLTLKELLMLYLAKFSNYHVWHKEQVTWPTLGIRAKSGKYKAFCTISILNSSKLFNTELWDTLSCILIRSIRQELSTKQWV